MSYANLTRALWMLVALAGVFAAWPGAARAQHQHGGGGGGAPAPAADSFYTCPMHPTIISDKPGQCPICGMDLVPKKNPNAAPAAGAAGPVVEIDAVVVQNMAVRVDHVRRGTIYRHVRTLGEVEVAEDEVSVVNLRFSGWVEKIWADETGKAVHAGARLFTIYSPDVIAAQEEFLLAVNTQGRDSKLAQASERRLKLWEIPDAHIARLLKEGNGQITLDVPAPRSGYILKKEVVLGARVMAGMDLYRIGNLRRIWVNAEVYDFDAPWVRVGQAATMELSFQAGRLYDGRVSYIYPTLNPRTRTLKVRLEFDNPGLNLKPGMFATVRIEAQRKDDALVVPSEAIIHSGERNIVFVTPRTGRYEPRRVVTGLVGDNQLTEVLEGLEEHDSVVVSGQFLLDSESHIQEAVQKMLDSKLQVNRAGAGGGEPPATPAAEGAPAGHDHDAREPATPASGGVYYTCPMHPTIISNAPGKCPICGMDLVQKTR